MSKPIADPALQAPEPAREIKPTSTPISFLDTPTAQAISSIAPVVLVSYFYLRFGALVADPIPTLAFDILPVAIVQSAYAILSLPLSRRTANGEVVKAAAAKNKTRTTRAAQQEVNIGGRTTNALIALILTAVSALPIFILLVLFGAPLTTHHFQTILCAAHFALLAVFPLLYTHGVDRQTWWEIGGAMLPFDSVWGTTIGTALGAWLGAVPIPLDWDREWQKWPVTIVAGMYAGALVGNLAGRYLFFGKRISFQTARSNKQDIKKTS